MFYKLWEVKEYLEHSERSRTFIYFFNVIVKFSEFFTTCEKPQKNLRHTERSRIFITSYKVIAKLVEVVTTCEKSQKYLGTQDV